MLARLACDDRSLRDRRPVRSLPDAQSSGRLPEDRRETTSEVARLRLVRTPTRRGLLRRRPSALTRSPAGGPSGADSQGPEPCAGGRPNHRHVGVDPTALQGASHLTESFEIIDACEFALVMSPPPDTVSGITRVVLSWVARGTDGLLEGAPLASCGRRPKPQVCQIRP